MKKGTAVMITAAAVLVMAGGAAEAQQQTAEKLVRRPAVEEQKGGTLVRRPASHDEAETPLEYTMTTGGYEDGKITVTVVMAPDKVSLGEVRIDDCSSQTDTIGQIAAPAMAKQIVEAGTVKVDGITGATQTCDAVKEAVRDGLEESRKKKDPIGKQDIEIKID